MAEIIKKAFPKVKETYQQKIDRQLQEIKQGLNYILSEQEKQSIEQMEIKEVLQLMSDNILLMRKEISQYIGDDKIE